MIWNKMQEIFSQIWDVQVLFSKKIAFSLKNNSPSGKVVIIVKEIYGIGNLVDLPRLMFINEECGNIRKKKSEVLQAYRCQICDKCYRQYWGKHGFSWGYFFCR